MNFHDVELFYPENCCSDRPSHIITTNIQQLLKVLFEPLKQLVHSKYSYTASPLYYNSYISTIKITIIMTKTW